MPHLFNLVEALKADHLIHRSYLTILKDEESSFKNIKKAFSILAPEFLSHIRREENIVYKFMLDHKNLKPLELTPNLCVFVKENSIIIFL